jgi:hypothetical protein
VWGLERSVSQTRSVLFGAMAHAGHGYTPLRGQGPSGLLSTSSSSVVLGNAEVR